jgi:hypothetical protein
MCLSYRNCHWYCCWESRQPMHVVPMWWCPHSFYACCEKSGHSIPWLLAWYWGGGGVSLPGYRYLAPFDFFLWGYLKSLIYKSPMETEGDLVTTILAGCEAIHNILGIFEVVHQSVVCHYSVCNEDVGCHFEQLLWISWNHTIKNNTRNIRPINIYENEARNLKKQVLTTEVGTCRLLAFLATVPMLVLVWRIRFQPRVSYLKLSSLWDTQQPLKVCKNYSVTLSVLVLCTEF